MHDLLEGVIPLAMKLVIEFLTKENFMTKESFQIAMQHFTFGKNDCKNKPDAWIRGTSYSLTASQSWCLFRTLPFIVEKFVPTDCKVWELFLLLSKICDIVFAPSFSMSWISYLDFYFMFIFIATNKIFPKCHFLLHYPCLMLRFGPLRFLWCMRFEACHQRIKKIAKRNQNFKNICYTVANRIQLLKCWEQQNIIQCLSNPIELHETKALSPIALPTALQVKLQSMEMELETVISVKEIQYQSECYKLGDIHVVDVIVEAYVFCKIYFILKVVSSWHFCGKLLFSCSFSQRLHAYTVHETDMWYIAKLGEQLTAHPLDVYSFKDSSFIRLRYRLPEDSNLQ